jgi:multidrug efflux pump subunit AcrA (membrane-fusion protein)
MRARYLIAAAAAAALLVAGVIVGYPGVASRSSEIPTTRPERGDVDVRIHARGHVAPHRTVGLSAPAVGSTLQLVRLLPAGTVVREGDVVMEFDPSGQHDALTKAKADFAEAEQEIRKFQADTRVKDAEDQLALEQARFDVRLAATKVSGNEFVGAIEARKNDLALEEARQKLAQLEEDRRTRAAGNVAALTALQEKRAKAQLATDLAQRQIDSMTVRAPMDGMVTIGQNQSAVGGFFYSGMTIPEFREGDTVQPGSPVASIIDLSAIEVTASLDESARTALGDGAEATVTFHAMPDTELKAKARRIGGMASQQFRWGAGVPQFEASFALESPNPQLRPGMSASIVASAEPVKDTLHLPRQALFDKDGQSIVYVRRNGTFVSQTVKVLRLTESRVAVEGLEPDAEVALADPGRTDEARPASPAGPIASAATR